MSLEHSKDSKPFLKEEEVLNSTVSVKHSLLLVVKGLFATTGEHLGRWGAGGGS